MIVIGQAGQPFSDLAFHPDGRRIALAGGTHSWTNLWDATTGAKLGGWPVGSIGRVGSIRFHPAGRWLFAMGEDALGVIDIETGEQAEYNGRFTSTPAISPAGNRVIVVSGRDRIVSLRVTNLLPTDDWTVRVGRGSSVWRCENVSFFPKGTRFASADYEEAWYGENSWIQIGSTKDGSVVDKIGCACGIPQQVAVSPDGKWVALRAAAALLVFHIKDAGKSVKLSSPNRKHLTGLAFHPSGRYLATTGGDTTVRLHDRDANWAVTRTFDWKIGGLKSVAFSPDGLLAAAGGAKGQIVLWDVDV